MSQEATCRYRCSGCDKELEQSGYISVDALDADLTRAVLDLTINTQHCPECNAVNRLPMPLLYHDGEKQLLVCYLPSLKNMDQIDIATSMRLPYEALLIGVAQRLGIELPKPETVEIPEDESQDSSLLSFLTQEQADELLPEYLLRPTVLDGMEVVSAIIQAVNDGMQTVEVLEDMARLQLINAVIEAKADPIERRKILHRNEHILNKELYEVLDTLGAQMEEEGNAEMSEKLKFVRREVERYSISLEKRARTGHA